jgi:hypothetical protein
VLLPPALGASLHSLNPLSADPAAPLQRAFSATVRTAICGAQSAAPSAAKHFPLVHRALTLAAASVLIAFVVLRFAHKAKQE